MIRNWLVLANCNICESLCVLKIDHSVNWLNKYKYMRLQKWNILNRKGNVEEYPYWVWSCQFCVFCDGILSASKPNG